MWSVAKVMATVERSSGVQAVWNAARKAAPLAFPSFNRFQSSSGESQRHAGPCLGSGAGWARLFPSPRNEGSDAPRRRVVRITPDGPDDHPGRTRIAGSWRISGCAAPTRRATRHLRLYAFNGSVGPARSLSATGGLPAAARGRDVCGVTLAGAASRPTVTTPHDDAPRWTGRP